MTNFQAQFRAARRAAAPLVLVRTADPFSTMELVKRSMNGKAETVPMLVWDVLRGVKPANAAGAESAEYINNGSDPKEVTAAPVMMLDRLNSFEIGRKDHEDIITFALNIHLFWKDPGVMQGIWNLREPFKASGRMLIMTATAGAILPSELAEDVLVIDEPLPTPEELRVILANISEAANIPALDETTTAAAIDAVAGIASFPAETAMAMSREKSGINLEMLWEKKRQAIEQIPGLTVHRGEAPEPVGLDAVREYIRKLAKGKRRYRCVLFLDEVEKMFAGAGTDLSGVTTKQSGAFLTWTQENKVDGVMFIGVAGGGKSMLAKWAGCLLGVPTIIWDVAGTQSGIIGSTEERMRAVFKTVDAVAQGNVLMIATCNSIGQMTPEMLRRFKKGVWFFDLMTGGERLACWNSYRRKFGLPTSDRLPVDDGWTGAEIESCCEQADQLSIGLCEAANYIVPVSRSSAEKIKNLRESCSGRYLSASKGGIYQSSEQDAGQKQIRKFEYEEPAKPKNAVGSTEISRVGAR